MPQDELWRASARLTGYHVAVAFDPLFRDEDQLVLTPQWSKRPRSERAGQVVLQVPTYARDYLPRLIAEGHEYITGGDPKHVPAAVRRELKLVLLRFQEGAIH